MKGREKWSGQLVHCKKQRLHSGVGEVLGTAWTTPVVSKQFLKINDNVYCVGCMLSYSCRLNLHVLRIAFTLQNYSIAIQDIAFMITPNTRAKQPLIHFGGIPLMDESLPISSGIIRPTVSQALREVRRVTVLSTYLLPGAQ